MFTDVVGSLYYMVRPHVGCLHEGEGAACVHACVGACPLSPFLLSCLNVRSQAPTFPVG